MNPYRSLFRNRNFLLHWLAGAISNVGDFFNSLALLKILSEDPAHLGIYMALVMIAKVVPGVVLGPVAGVLADRLSRRRIMVVSDLLRAVLVLGLVVVERPLLIMTLVFLSAMVSAFFSPASNALLPSLVAKAELVSAGSLAVMTQRLAMLVGNGIGAVVLIAGGPHSVFYIDAASFVVSAVMLGAMALPAVSTATQATTTGAQTGIWRKFRSDLDEALSFLKAAPVVRHLIGTFAISNVGDSALNVLLVTFFTVGLGLAAESFGFVMALFGGASVLGALIIGALGNRVAWRHLIIFGCAYAWATMMGALITQRLIPSVTFMTLLGLGSGAINVGIQAAVGELVPDHVRGRIFSAWNMVQNLIFIAGALLAGSLSDTFGPTRVLMGFVSAFLVAGLYAYFAFRSRPAGAPVRSSTIAQ